MFCTAQCTHFPASFSLRLSDNGFECDDNRCWLNSVLFFPVSEQPQCSMLVNCDSSTWHDPQRCAHCPNLIKINNNNKISILGWDIGGGGGAVRRESICSRSPSIEYVEMFGRELHQLIHVLCYTSMPLYWMREHVVWCYSMLFVAHNSFLVINGIRNDMQTGTDTGKTTPHQ